jgi:hypothetical protein
VHRQIVEHDDIARAERRHEHSLDISEERRLVDRTVEDRGRSQTVEPECGDDSVSLPVAAGRMVA